MGLNWNFQRDGEIQTKKPSVGGYGYFLEQHNTVKKTYSFFLGICLPISGLGLEYPLVCRVGIKSFALGPTPNVAASFNIPRSV